MTANVMTTYMGMRLKSPIVPSSSPVTGKIDSLRSLEEAGAGAVVLPSLFEEQIEHEAEEAMRLAEFGIESFGEATTGYFPQLSEYPTGSSEYLSYVEKAASRLAIPVIASLNGVSGGGWLRYARRLEAAGADALELNVYLLPTSVDEDGGAVEDRYVELVEQVCGSVEIPVAVKIGPYFSSIPNMAVKLRRAGAQGLSLFNRFYQPDVDLEELVPAPHVELSTSSELRLPMRWIAILRDQVDVSLALTSGVHTHHDVVKATAIGADVTMMASALLKRGEGHVAVVLDRVVSWLDEHEYDSLDQLRGSLSYRSVSDPEAYVRANYMKMLVSYTKSVGR